MVSNVFSSFNNINYYINRVKPYNPKGRNQSEEEANNLIPILKDILKDYNVRYCVYDGIEEDYDKIVNEVLLCLKEFNMNGLKEVCK